MGDARMRMKELCDRMAWQLSYKEHQSGPSHGLLFTVEALATQSGVVWKKGTGVGSTKSLAKELACLNALQSDAERESREEERSAAWMGDAGAELLIPLLAHGKSLSAAELDTISQALCSNEWLAANHHVQLSSVTATATAAEAAVGRELAAVREQLLAVLLPAVKRGNPRLVAAMQAAVAKGGPI